MGRGALYTTTEYGTQVRRWITIYEDSFPIVWY